MCPLENRINVADGSNEEETHVVDIDNGRTLGLMGETEVRYLDVERGSG